MEYIELKGLENERLFINKELVVEVIELPKGSKIKISTGYKEFDIQVLNSYKEVVDLLTEDKLWARN